VELQEHPDEPVVPARVGSPGHVEPTEGSATGLTDAEQAEDERVEAARRRRPSTVGGAIYLAVLAAAGVGLGIVAHGNWRLGVKWIAASLVVAALVRLALPAREAGMLAVRRRAIDVGLLATVGVGLWFLSVSIPNQPLP
jgi:cation transport ATPase